MGKKPKLMNKGSLFYTTIPPKGWKYSKKIHTESIYLWDGGPLHMNHPVSILPYFLMLCIYCCIFPYPTHQHCLPASFVITSGPEPDRFEGEIFQFKVRHIS